MDSIGNLFRKKSIWIIGVLGLFTFSFAVTFLFKYPNVDGKWKTTDGLKGCYCNYGPYIKADLNNANNQRHLLSGFIDLGNARAVVRVERIPPNFENDINKITLNTLSSERYEGVSTWVLSDGHYNSKPLLSNNSSIVGSKVSEVCDLKGFNCRDFFKPSIIWKSAKLVFLNMVQADSKLGL